MSESEATSVSTGDIVQSDGTTLFVIAGPNDQVWLVNPNYYGPVYVLHAKKGFDYRLPEGYTIVRRARYSPQPETQPQFPTFWRRTTEAPTRQGWPIVVIGQHDPLRDWTIVWPTHTIEYEGGLTVQVESKPWRFDMKHQTHWCYWTDILAAHPLTPWP